jgi:ethanolamine utilization protein EutN
VYLARVIGRLVATSRYEGLDGVAFQLIQPLDEHGADTGDTQVAAVQTSVVSAGPGDFVTCVDGREAALVLDETFVPIDVAIIGVVEEATRLGTNITPLAHGAGV